MPFKHLLPNFMGRLVDTFGVGLRGRGPSSSGSTFSLTIPVSGTFTLTAAGNATGVTAEAWGKKVGATNGDYAKTANLSIVSGNTRIANVDNGGSPYSSLYLGDNVTPVIIACDGSASGSANFGDTVTLNANAGSATVKLAGTTAGTGFTSPTAIRTIRAGAGGKAELVIHGNHGISDLGTSLAISGTAGYDGTGITISAFTATTLTIGTAFGASEGASNTALATTVVGSITPTSP